MRHFFPFAKPISLAFSFACLFLVFGFGNAQAAPISMNWSGTILQVFEDTGSTTFSGTQAGDAFSGSFGYDSEPGSIVPGCDSTLCEWSWNGPNNIGSISGGPDVDGVFLIIENDQDLSDTPEDLDIINSILDPDIDENTPFDLWELSSDLITGDDFLFFSVVWVTTDTSAIADASVYDPLPPFAIGPIAGQGRAAAFVIEESSSTGDFFAIGLLDTADVAAVPVPAAVWLFGSALGLLGWGTRRARKLD
ncbi:MAG: hypothetical protein ACN4GT_03530 [Gammaproteobacteria bacterium]